MVQRGDAVRDVERRRPRTAGSRRRPARAGTGRRAPRRSAPRPRPMFGSARMSVPTYVQPRGITCCAPQHFAAPTSSTRMPGRSTLEQQPEGVLVRAPGEVVPAEVAVHVREHGVDLVVGLVPALVARHLRPALRLAPLLGHARRGLVEQARDAVLDGVLAAAALQRSSSPATRAAAGRAAEELERVTLRQPRAQLGLELAQAAPPVVDQPQRGRVERALVVGERLDVPAHQLPQHRLDRRADAAAEARAQAERRSAETGQSRSASARAASGRRRPARRDPRRSGAPPRSAARTARRRRPARSTKSLQARCFFRRPRASEYCTARAG